LFEVSGNPPTAPAATFVPSVKGETGPKTACPPAPNPLSQLSKKESKGGSSNPNPGPLIETPIILPIALTMALPVAP
jgi:hypothetical protein